jgi:hypothetical protein
VFFGGYWGKLFNISSPPTGPLLAGPSGTSILCWGEKEFTLSFSGRLFKWTLLLADVKFPILGVDFLRHHRLLVDPAENQLITTTGSASTSTPPSQLSPMVSPVISVPGSPAVSALTPPAPSTFAQASAATSSGSSLPPASAAAVNAPVGSAAAALSAGEHSSSSSPPPALAVATVNVPLGSAAAALSAGGPSSSSSPADTDPSIPFAVWLKDFLLEFDDVVNPSKALPPLQSSDVFHHIKTTGPPIASRFCRLDGEKLAAAKKEFEQLERDGIVRRSDSPWSSPLHMVEKADGIWWPCGDFWRLNLVIEPDSYPLPNMLDFAHVAAGCSIFSKIDLRKGYHQILVHPDNICKAAISTPFGLFEYTFACHSACGTPATRSSARSTG